MTREKTLEETKKRIVDIGVALGYNDHEMTSLVLWLGEDSIKGHLFNLEERIREDNA